MPGILSIDPVLAKEWDYEKNEKGLELVVTKGMHRKIWWHCPAGHSYQSSIHNRRKGAKCGVCSNYVLLKGFNDLKTKFPTIAIQWNPEKNAPLTSSDVTATTARKVWWKCTYGHEWESRVYKRTVNARGCPVCTNQKIVPGFNDLAFKHPELLNQWHPTKNSFGPTTISPSSGKIVWWVCEKGHEWETSAANRVTQKAGCHYCTGQKRIKGENDLATTNPELLKFWHFEKNTTQTPEMVGPSSKAKVWWVCEKGHEYIQSVSSKTKGASVCVICSGARLSKGVNDLQTTHPDIAAAWDFKLNGTKQPSDVFAGSHSKAWWCCSKGHSWCAVIGTVTKGTGCNICANLVVLQGFNDLATRHPEVIKEWDYAKNGSLLPTAVTYKSAVKAWWTCEVGHSWCAKVYSRHKSGCPDCANYGYKGTLPGYVYLLGRKVGDGVYRKIGITNAPNSRLRIHANNGWEVLEVSKEYKDGKIPQRIERNFLNFLKQQKILTGRKLYAKAFDGYTESWSYLALPIDTLSQVFSRIDKQK